MPGSIFKLAANYAVVLVFIISSSVLLTIEAQSRRPDFTSRETDFEDLVAEDGGVYQFKSVQDENISTRSLLGQLF